MKALTCSSAYSGVKTCSLNHTRYQSWPQQASKAAGFAFDGPAYKALDMASLQQADLQFAQQHVRILDALYGILRPLDSIKPYRLEMSNKINTSKGSSMYSFWGNLLTDSLNRQEDASCQYAPQQFTCRYIVCLFTF